MGRRIWTLVGAIALFGAITTLFATGAQSRAFRADLQIRSATAKLSHNSLTGTATVANRGKARAAASSLTISWRASRGGAWQQRGTAATRALKAGQRANVRFSVSVPANAARGSYDLRACADGRSQIKELSEANNCASAGRISIKGPLALPSPTPVASATPTVFAATPTPTPAPKCPTGETGSPPNCQTPGPNSDRGAILSSGETLDAGSYLESPNGSYRLIMQGDGNLVLYEGAVTCATSCSGKAIWNSETGGDNGAVATMQADGNLVVYYNGAAVWNSNTWGFSGDYLKLQDDSNLVIYQDSHPVWDWGSGDIGNVLEPGTTLVAGDELISPGRGFELIMQGDGNLVLYQGAVACPTASCSGDALWNSGTGGDIGASVTMQSDGNLVVHYNGAAVWNSQTSGFSGASLHLQDDSNLVIYQGGTARWDWGSGSLGGGGGTQGTTVAEQSAIAWARTYADAHSHTYLGLCLSFVFDAYTHAGLNLRPWVNYAINADTYPSDIWGKFNHGSTGTGSPPPGALVFWVPANGDRTNSHVALSLGGGNIVSTSDSVDESGVHYETIAQHAYAVYQGWWLPDQ
jgi:hypothetical protein